MRELGFGFCSVGLELSELPWLHQAAVLLPLVRDRGAGLGKVLLLLFSNAYFFWLRKTSELGGVQYGVFCLGCRAQGSRCLPASLGSLGVCLAPRRETNFLYLLPKIYTGNSVSRFLWKLCFYGAQPPAGMEIGSI